MSDRCQVIASHGAACVREAGHDGPHSTVVGSRWHESEIESLRQQHRGAVEEHRAFVDALTKALNDHGVPAMPSWREAIDWLAANGGSR